jgi:ribosomal protein S18 acetylase RimI-like enzyme
MPGPRVDRTPGPLGGGYRGSVPDLELLRRIDTYLDAVPRSACRAEAVGPFTLFVNERSAWPYYARPTLGADRITVGDIEGVRARQRELGLTEAFEWVENLVPGLGSAAARTGLAVITHPLMHLPPGAIVPASPPDEAVVRTIEPDDDLARIGAVAQVAFANPGTAAGPVGTEALTPLATATEPATTAFVRQRIEDGITVTVAAFVNGEPVASGSHQPADGATEIVGVACLPAYRRRGLGAAVTSMLVRDALSRGVTTVCLSADDEDVARVYARLGFEAVGAVGAAEPPP